MLMLDVTTIVYYAVNCPWVIMGDTHRVMNLPIYGKAVRVERHGVMILTVIIFMAWDGIAMIVQTSQANIAPKLGFVIVVKIRLEMLTLISITIIGSVTSVVIHQTPQSLLQSTVD
mmetsp:Transcript_37985/g.41167  ORF Transcript_37985/g.41167 Transcript_37985/m.41167 type:complete len:116 (+) Transcript_37985:291-638(+)